MSIEKAVESILDVAELLHPQAKPELATWFAGRSDGQVAELEKEALQAWFSGMCPKRAKAEYGWVMVQVNWLSVLYPPHQPIFSKKEGSHE
jgi:hypothetical protein